MQQPDDFDPEATIWGSVSELELKGYTKEEVHAALQAVAEAIRPEGGFSR
jgi:hypothetical protein